MKKFAHVKSDGEVIRTGTNTKVGFERWASGEAETDAGGLLNFVYDMDYEPEQMLDKGSAMGDVYKVSTASRAAFADVFAGGSWDVITEVWTPSASHVTGWAAQEYQATLNWGVGGLPLLKQNMNSLAKTIVRKLIFSDAMALGIIFNDPDIMPGGFTERYNDRKTKLATFQTNLQSAADYDEVMATYATFKNLVGWRQ